MILTNDLLQNFNFFFIFVRINDHFAFFMPQYSDDTFKWHFRIGRKSFHSLVDYLKDCSQFIQRNSRGKKDRAIQADSHFFMVHGIKRVPENSLKPLGRNRECYLQHQKTSFWSNSFQTRPFHQLAKGRILGQGC